jgi:hypothetical protein
MQSLGFAGAFAAVAMAGAATSPISPSDPPATVAAWRCEGDQCGGGGPNGPSAGDLFRECVKVVSVIGPVSRFQSGGRELSAHDLAQCNRRATRPPAGE